MSVCVYVHVAMMFWIVQTNSCETPLWLVPCCCETNYHMFSGLKWHFAISQSLWVWRLGLGSVGLLLRVLPSWIQEARDCDLIWGLEFSSRLTGVRIQFSAAVDLRLSTPQGHPLSLGSLHDTVASFFKAERRMSTPASLLGERAEPWSKAILIMESFLPR